MITVLTEKPSVAQEISKVIGATERSDGFLYGNGYYVTWAMGHLVEIYSPEADGEWSAEKLPIIPKTFYLRTEQKDGKPDKGKSRQLNIIKSLFEKSTSVIFATDAGREGELIARYIYYYLKCNLPVQRLWISSMTKEAIAKGFRELMNDSEFDNLYLSAKARSEADWIVGINATRALTTTADCGKVLSLGRVQTPTLGMICKRYIENVQFTPEKYWYAVADCEENGIHFKMKGEHCKNEDEISDFISRMQQAGVIKITKNETTEKRTAPPLLHDITSLQREANKIFGYTAEKTLSIAQELYETHKMLTYPRTGSRYIPEDVFKTIPQLIEGFRDDQQFSEIARSIDLGNLNRHSVNDTKITDHHALLPTGKMKSEDKLTEDEWNIFDLVALRMFEAFEQDFIYNSTIIEGECAGVVLRARGTTPLHPGWKRVKGLGKDKEDEEAQTLPAISKTEIKPLGITKEEGVTKPKALLTDDTLLSEMSSPAADITDEKVRERLNKVGLGTPATRASIIETLVNRRYVEREKKKLLPTRLGLSVYNIVKDKAICDPVWTGKWENALEYIAEGKTELSKFNSAIRNYSRQITSEMLDENNRAIIRKSLTSETVRCPKCGGVMKIVENRAYCTNKSCDCVIWREVCGKKLTEAEVILLAEGGETGVIKGFTSKKGNKFNAKLRRNPSTGKIEIVYV